MKKLKAIGQTGKSARTLKGTTKNPLAIETLAGDGLIPHKKCWGSHLHVMRYADFKKCKICCPRTTMLSWDKRRGMVLSRKFYNTYFGRRNEVIRDYAATLKPNISLAMGNTTSDASCG